MKTCFKCNVSKPIDQFYEHPMMADGHLGKCKECAKVDVRARYRLTIEQHQEYERIRNQYPERKKAKSGYAKNHKRLYPQRRRARVLAGSALSCGRITKQPCSVCGAQKSEMHHDDYLKPLQVTWLCLKHHRERDRELVHVREQRTVALI